MPKRFGHFMRAVQRLPASDRERLEKFAELLKRPAGEKAQQTYGRIYENGNDNGRVDKAGELG